MTNEDAEVEGLVRASGAHGLFLRGAGASPELNPMVSGSHVDSLLPPRPQVSS